MKSGDRDKQGIKIIAHACMGCGKVRWVRLIKGKPQYQKCSSCAKTTHGGSRTKIYGIWQDMKWRCYSPSNKNEIYQKIGITVCPEWLCSFEVFRDFALANGYKDGLSIDRINPNGNYESSNCQFLTKSEHGRKSAFERKKH
jgi:hypothetical protein